MLLLALLVLPVLVSACMFGREGGVPWYEARRDPTGLAPDPAANARGGDPGLCRPRRRLARHRRGAHLDRGEAGGCAAQFTRYEVVGFGVAGGAPAVRIDRTGPDNYWFGARPELVLDRRGAGVDALIDKMRAAVDAYPYPHEYRAWPGPNSNTFTAFVARAVPELGLALPSNADRQGLSSGGAVFAAAPSGTGYQISLFGVAGVLLARAEGIEINLLGLNLGIDFASPGVKLPGIGRIGIARATDPA